MTCSVDTGRSRSAVLTSLRPPRDSSAEMNLGPSTYGQTRRRCKNGGTPFVGGPFWLRNDPMSLDEKNRSATRKEKNTALPSTAPVAASSRSSRQLFSKPLSRER